MRIAFPTAGLVLVAGLLGLSGGASPSDTHAVKTIRPFTLKDYADKAHSWKDYQDRKAVVVVFIGTECPVNNFFMPRLSELHKTYSARGVAFLGINSNVHDTPTRIAAHARAHGIPFPVLKDTANVVADDFGAKRTPEAFLLDPRGKIVYHGRIDDQFGVGYKRKQPANRDLASAIDELLAGKAISKPSTEVSGCIIARARKPKATGTVTYARHVSRIIQARCQECHRPGEVGPMPLLTYEDALAWSAMIQEVVEDGRMPPWHADPRHGKFSNDRSLSKAERATLLKWIEEGCPKGDIRDLPEAKTWPKGWRIGEPDVVFSLKSEVPVPAKASAKGIAYQYFVVPTDFKEDRWVQAAEARPGAREVVHHIIVYVVPAGFRLGAPRPANRKPDAPARGRGPAAGCPGPAQDGIGRGLLVAYAPGDMPLLLKPGQAKKIPKGANLLFQMHYTPDGVQRKDRSSVGLVFAKKPPSREVNTRGVAQRLFMIPPQTKSHEVTSRSTFDQEVDLLSLMPHMHLRGKDFKYDVVFPGGKRQTLLVVPRYDFNWQASYRLDKPLRLPAGTRIECTAHFDNSSDNPNNPDPERSVLWGDQTWEEMMIGFVDYALVQKK
jgi:peroxiredoxin